MVLHPFSYQLWLYSKNGSSMLHRVPEENTEHCCDCSLPCFWSLLCDRCVVLFREIYTPVWLFHFGPSWCTIEDKWKWWRVRDSRQSWRSDSVAEGQGLMHPFLLSKWFLSLCFLYDPGRKWGVLIRAVWKTATSVQMRKMWPKSRTGYSKRRGRNSACSYLWLSLIMLDYPFGVQPQENFAELSDLTQLCPASLKTWNVLGVIFSPTSSVAPGMVLLVCWSGSATLIMY